jgi:hypothetical protein
MSSRKILASKKKQSGRKNVDWKVLDIMHPDAAGIDVSGHEHWVAVSPDRDADPMRRFGCFTADLREMARWLTEKGVRSVAMQSTAYPRCRCWKSWSSTDWKSIWSMPGTPRICPAVRATFRNVSGG